MKIRKIDNCVGCSTVFGNCQGSACPYYPYETVVCDECEEEPYEDEQSGCKHLYYYNGEWLCRECLLDKFRRIDVDEYMCDRERRVAL